VHLQIQPFEAGIRFYPEETHYATTFSKLTHDHGDEPSSNIVPRNTIFSARLQDIMVGSVNNVSIEPWPNQALLFESQMLGCHCLALFQLLNKPQTQASQGINALRYVVGDRPIMACLCHGLMRCIWSDFSLPSWLGVSEPKPFIYIPRFPTTT